MHNLLTGQATTSVCQLAEWGMRQIQAKFPRMLEKIKYKERVEQRIMLNLTVLCSIIIHVLKLTITKFYGHSCMIKITILVMTTEFLLKHKHKCLHYFKYLI